MALLAETISIGCQLILPTPEEEAARIKAESANLELKATKQAVTTEEWEVFKNRI